jgi:hypothetical protein
LCDIVFPSKQAGKVDRFLDRYQIAVVSAVEPNSAGAKFPVVMSFVTPLVENFHSLITTNCSKREQKDLNSISLMRRCLYCCSNGFPIWDFPRQRRYRLLTYSREVLQFVEFGSVFREKGKMLFALLDDVFTGCCVQRPL